MQKEIKNKIVKNNNMIFELNNYQLTSEKMKSK